MTFVMIEPYEGPQNDKGSFGYCNGSQKNDCEHIAPHSTLISKSNFFRQNNY